MAIETLQFMSFLLLFLAVVLVITLTTSYVSLQALKGGGMAAEPLAAPQSVKKSNVTSADEKVRREKALDFSGCNSRPGNWFAPPGSNRNGSGGNEAVGAFDGKGR
jgi:hypothetical protein